MLRLNLWRETDVRVASLAKSGPGPGREAARATTPPEKRGGKNAARAVLVTLLALGAFGVVALFLLKPEWRLHLNAGGTAREAARADSLRRVELLIADASRQVTARQERALSWLEQLETTFPAGFEGYALTMSSFTGTGAFVLRGTAETAEDASAAQEALVLVPGLDLRESRVEEAGDAPGAGYSFYFAGTVSFPADSAAPGSTGPARVLATDGLDAEWENLMRIAGEESLVFSAPRPGPVIAAGPLQLRTYRLAGECATNGSAACSAPYSALRNMVLGEKNRRSPFGIQRVTMEHREGRSLVFLDIMAFTP